MISFISHSSAPTPSSPDKVINQSFPFAGIGNQTGTYALPGPSMPKHIKMSVSSITNDPLLLLDTHDLHYNMGSTDFYDPAAKVDGVGYVDGALMTGLPISFNRIHFRASAGPQESVDEYYATFLASKPVAITFGGMVGNRYASSIGCAGVGDTPVYNGATVRSWNNTTSEIDGLNFSGRLIIGDTVSAQINTLQRQSACALQRCPPWGGKNNQDFFIGEMDFNGNAKTERIPVMFSGAWLYRALAHQALLYNAGEMLVPNDEGCTVNEETREYKREDSFILCPNGMLSGITTSTSTSPCQITVYGLYISPTCENGELGWTSPAQVELFTIPFPCEDCAGSDGSDGSDSSGGGTPPPPESTYVCYQERLYDDTLNCVGSSIWFANGCESADTFSTACVGGFQKTAIAYYPSLAECEASCPAGEPLSLHTEPIKEPTMMKPNLISPEILAIIQGKL